MTIHAFIVNVRGDKLVEYIDRRITRLREDLEQAKRHLAEQRPAAAPRSRRGIAGVALPYAAPALRHLRPVPTEPGLVQAQEELRKLGVTNLDGGPPHMVTAVDGKLPELPGLPGVPEDLDVFLQAQADTAAHELELSIADWEWMRDVAIDREATYQLSWHDLHSFGLFSSSARATFPLLYR